MSRLSKQQASLHAKACALLEKEVLTFDERLYVLDHWQESAEHINTVSGAFFTPQNLAREVTIEMSGRKVIDLCAGIGSLAFAYYHSEPFNRKAAVELVCVEIKPDYAAVGRKVLPEARWIVGNVLDLPGTMTETFDCAIANPPFGRTKREGKSPCYSGGEFEYSCIDVAAEIAHRGVFLIPQGSCPFAISGVQNFRTLESDKYSRFHEQTGITLSPNCGIDTTVAQREWHHSIAVTVEIALAEFAEVREQRSAARQPKVVPSIMLAPEIQGNLFAAA